MRVHVRLEMPTGEPVTVGHGAIVGRLPTAAVHIADPRVSEAHALVSLRGRDVHLLALRGRFTVDGRTVASAVLEPGLTIGLAKDLWLRVLAVELPHEVMALRGPFGTQVLLGPTSIFDHPPRLEHGWRPGALAVVWPLEDKWFVGDGDGDELTAGMSVTLPGMTVQAVSEPTQAMAATKRSAEFTAAMRIVAKFDSVHLQRLGQPTVVLTGIIARVITELVQTEAAMEWELLARQIWPDADRDTLRRRWDMQLVRLRSKLRDNGVRTDLLRPDGSGLIELVLGRGDEVVDEA